MTAPEVDQIKIGKHMFGIVGLKDAFAAITGEHAEKPDDVLADLLLERLAGRNYIPEKARAKYGEAFLREFKKFRGYPVADDASNGLVIKVLGGGCAVCDNLENMIMETLAALGMAADLEHVRDAEQIAQYRVATRHPANSDTGCSKTLTAKQQEAKWTNRYLLRTYPFPNRSNWLTWLLTRKAGLSAGRSHKIQPSV